MNAAQVDQYLFELANRGFQSSVLDVFMAALSSGVLWKPVIIGSGMLVLLFGGFKGRAVVICAVAIVLIADACVANTIKSLTKRPRPYQAMAGVRVVRLQRSSPRFLALGQRAAVNLSTLPSSKRENRSFPSGHVTNNFAFGVVLAWFYRRLGWIYFIVATLVACSRVYVGDHYPSDVIAGALVGAGVAAIIMTVLDLSWRNYAANFFPKLANTHPTLAA